MKAERRGLVREGFSGALQLRETGYLGLIFQVRVRKSNIDSVMIRYVETKRNEGGTGFANCRDCVLRQLKKKSQYIAACNLI